MGHSVAVTRPDHTRGRQMLAVIVLAAGAGRRLAPLSDLRPKPLCPVANRALIDLALDRVAALGAPVAVNLHHGADAVRAHLAGRRVAPTCTSRRSSPRRSARPGPSGRCGAGSTGATCWSSTPTPGPRATSRPFVAGWDRARPSVLVHGDRPLRAAGRGGRQPAPVGRGPSARAGADRALRGGVAPLPRGRRARRRAPRRPVRRLRHPDRLPRGQPRRPPRWPARPVVDPSASVAAGVGRRGGRWSGRARSWRAGWRTPWCGRATRVGPGEVLVRSVRASATLTLGPLGAGSAPPGVTSWLARSWPQAASMSVPRLRRHGGVDARGRARWSRKAAHPLGRRAGVRRSPGVGLSGMRLTWARRRRAAAASSSASDGPVVDPVDQRPLEREAPVLGRRGSRRRPRRARRAGSAG